MWHWGAPVPETPVPLSSGAPVLLQAPLPSCLRHQFQHQGAPVLVPPVHLCSEGSLPPPSPAQNYLSYIYSSPILPYCYYIAGTGSTIQAFQFNTTVSCNALKLKLDWATCSAGGAHTSVRTITCFPSQLPLLFLHLR